MVKIYGGLIPLGYQGSGRGRGEPVVNGTVIAVLVGVGLVGLIVWALRLLNPVNRLRNQYLRRVRQTPAEAEQSLARHLARLQERYPGRSEAWYLRRILADLERDRR
jgi:hypothetical protein